MKNLLFLLSLCFSLLLNGQVGINSIEPKATLDINAISTDNTTAEGLIAPRLTGNQIKSKDAQYTSAQAGTLIYATSAVTTPSTKTQNISKSGYYFFDGSIWIAVSGADTTDDAWINKSGVVNMAKLSDGITTRTTNQQFTFKDNGSATFGSALTTYPSKLTLVNNASGNPLNDNLEITSFGPANQLGNQVYPIIDISASVGTETSPENFPDSRSTPVGVGEIRWNARASGARTAIAQIGVRYAGSGTTSDGILNLYTSGGMGDGVTIDQNNNVGIGEATPNSKLQVGGSLSLPIRSFSGNVLDTDYTILGTGNVTLPSASGKSGRVYRFIYDGVDYVVIAPSFRWDGSRLTNVAFSINTTRRNSLTVQSDGQDWVIINEERVD